MSSNFSGGNTHALAGGYRPHPTGPPLLPLAAREAPRRSARRER